MSNLFNPTVVRSTVECSGGTQEPSTQHSTETSYWLQEGDTIYIGPTQIQLERGRYGDAEREVVRLQAADDLLADAIVAAVRTQHQLANDPTLSEYSRTRAKALLERITDALA